MVEWVQTTRCSGVVEGVVRLTCGYGARSVNRPGCDGDLRQGLGPDSYVKTKEFILSQPQHINSAKPFVSTAQEYVNHGWSVIPLPERSKELKLTGVTGFHPVPDEKQIQLWINDDDYAKANIALRLGNIIEIDGKNCEVMALDVDHYNDKTGGDTLKALEEKLGELPETWICTARPNGISGHRYYLVPVGYRFKAKAGLCLDIIQKRHRYAAIFPSWNPSANEQYYWYEPGVIPDGTNFADDIPYVTELAFLPEEWLKFVTKDYTIDEGEKYDFDLNITRNNLQIWADKTLPMDEGIYDHAGGMCPAMLKKAAYWVDIFENCTTVHDNLVEAHWNTLLWAKEGHYGWQTALGLIEASALDAVRKLNNRTTGSFTSEVRRSKEGTLRKIKGMYDYEKRTGDAIGLLAGIGVCTCPEPVKDDKSGWPQFAAKPCDQYEMNDDGNAEHWLDVHKDCVHYVSNVYDKWIIWDGRRWVIDEVKVARGLYRRVKRAQTAFAKKLWKEYERVKGQTGAGKFRDLAKNWANHALKSGTESQVNSALKAAQSFHDRNIMVKYESLDADLMKLGLDGQIVHFNSKADGGGFEVIDNDPNFLITKYTGVPYIPLAEQEKYDDPEVRLGYKLFTDFTQKFLFDPDYLQKLFGYSILGINDLKKAYFLHGETNTGKSTLQNLLVGALGDYGSFREPRIFRNKDLNPMLATALPMRVICISELGKGEIHADIFKRITGNEPVPCELKGSNEGVFMKARCTLFIACNAPPPIPDEDAATRNRILSIPFNHQVLGDDDIKTASDDLLKHGKTAMLAWLIEGCDRAIREGLEPYPDEIVMETRDFVSNLSEIGSFVSDCLDIASDDLKKEYSGSAQGWPKEWVVNEEEMFQRFSQWQDVNVKQQDRIQKPMFTRRLKGVGIEQKGQTRVNGILLRKWVGIQFKSTKVKV